MALCLLFVNGKNALIFPVVAGGRELTDSH